MNIIFIALISVIILIIGINYASNYLFGVDIKSYFIKDSKVSDINMGLKENIPYSPTLARDIGANWKTHNFKEYGYSIKVPNNYFIVLSDLEPTDVYLQLVQIARTKPYPDGILIGVYPGESLEDSIQSLDQFPFPTTNREDLMINNHPWVKFYISKSEGEIYVTYINQRAYTVQGINNQLISQILSTFKFTD